MRSESALLYRCPQCLGELQLSIHRKHGGEVWDGWLNCGACQLDYPIADGMPFFGLNKSKAIARQQEMDAEQDWNFARTSLEEHLEYGRAHFPRTNAVICHLKDTFLAKTPDPLALDVGAGAGAISYLLSRHGLRTIATELGPENLAVGEAYSRAAWFERAVTDVEVLPFSGDLFDLVFCKELAHHMDDLAALFDELARVLKPGGVLVVIEPFKPQFSLFSKSQDYDRAKEAGLGHQDYHLSAYLTALEATGLAVREVFMIVFRGQRHPKVVQFYRALEKLVGADKWGRGMWFKKLVAWFFGGSVTVVGTKGGERREQRSIGSRSRKIQVISPERLSRFRDEIEHVKANIGPFIQLLDQVYEMHRKDSVS